MPRTAVDQPNATAVKAMAAIAGCVSLGILVQAVTVTGGIVSRNSSHKGLINAHSGVAYLVAVLAAVVVAFMIWRGKAGGQVVVAETIALLVGVILQIGIGQQIGDVNQAGKHQGLLALHVPLRPDRLRSFSAPSDTRLQRQAQPALSEAIPQRQSFPSADARHEAASPPRVTDWRRGTVL